MPWVSAARGEPVRWEQPSPSLSSRQQMSSITGATCVQARERTKQKRGHPGQISAFSLQSVQQVPEGGGRAIVETGSDRRTEVPDGCGGLPRTRTFGTFVEILSSEQ